MKFTLLTRDRADYPVDRFSERKESAEALTRRVNLSASTSCTLRPVDAEVRRGEPARMDGVARSGCVIKTSLDSIVNSCIPELWKKTAPPMHSPPSVTLTASPSSGC